MRQKYFLLFFFLVFSLYTPVTYADEEKMTIVIDPGHGGRDPGAKGKTANEKAINLAVALKLGELISTNYNDVSVIYTRKNDKFVELSERANIANRNKADLFISIHTNAVKKGASVTGVETYTLGLAKTDENLEVAMQENAVILLEDNYLQQYDGFDPNSSESYIIFEFMQNKYMEKSVTFASEIQKAFSSANRVNRGVRQAGFLVLKATSMPSVLVELGFISNPDEEKYMNSAKGQDQLAKSIYNAFVRYRKGGNYIQGAVAEKDIVQSQPGKPARSGDSNVAKPNSKTDSPSPIVYKIQIMSSEKKLSFKSSRFKGYKVQFYKEGNLYKYTYGESTDKSVIQKMHKKISKDFKDSFIIRMKDGYRLK